MELNSIEDVKALTEYKKLEQIESIEKKIKKLSYVPAISCAVLIIWAYWATWSGTEWSPMNMVLVAISIGSVGYSNVQRTDLLKQLFELKYGKQCTFTVPIGYKGLRHKQFPPKGIKVYKPTKVQRGWQASAKSILHLLIPASFVAISIWGYFQVDKMPHKVDENFDYSVCINEQKLNVFKVMKPTKLDLATL